MNCSFTNYHWVFIYWASSIVIKMRHPHHLGRPCLPCRPQGQMEALNHHHHHSQARRPRTRQAYWTSYGTSRKWQHFHRRHWFGSWHEVPPHYPRFGPDPPPQVRPMRGKWFAESILKKYLYGINPIIYSNIEKLVFTNPLSENYRDNILRNLSIPINEIFIEQVKISYEALQSIQ